MERETFLKEYNPHNKMTITYKDHETGDKIKGLLLDTITKGVAGHSYVNVDNFYKRCFLHNILSLKDTGKAWTDKP